MTDDELDHRECAETVTGEIGEEISRGRRNPHEAHSHDGPEGGDETQAAAEPLSKISAGALASGNRTNGGGPTRALGNSADLPAHQPERCTNDDEYGCNGVPEVFPGGNDKPGYCQRCWTRSLQGEQW